MLSLTNHTACIITCTYYFSYLSGVVTLPLTFMASTPVDCVIHPDLWGSNSNDDDDDDDDHRDEAALTVMDSTNLVSASYVGIVVCCQAARV